MHCYLLSDAERRAKISHRKRTQNLNLLIHQPVMESNSCFLFIVSAELQNSVLEYSKIKEHWSLKCQQVVISNTYSHEVDVASGVPQGSVFDSLLFIWMMLYWTLLPCASSQMTASFHVNNQVDCTALQHDLNNITDWCRSAQGMHINLKKKKKFVSSTRKRSSYKYKYIGVVFTAYLLWHLHTEHITAKARRTQGFLHHNTKHFPSEIKQLLYTTYIRTVLDYACTVPRGILGPILAFNG